jgi:hypothetical protein
MASGMRGNLTTIGIFVSFYSVSTVFTSPIDYLLVFDDGPLPLLLFLGLALFIRRQRTKVAGGAGQVA